MHAKSASQLYAVRLQFVERVGSLAQSLELLTASSSSTLNSCMSGTERHPEVEHATRHVAFPYGVGSVPLYGTATTTA